MLLPPSPLSQTVTPSRTPSPSSVTYFMDGPNVCVCIVGPVAYTGPLCVYRLSFVHSFIHCGHFYSAPSSHLLVRGAPEYSTDTVSEFHAEAHRQLQVYDLPKVPTWRLERESNPRPSG